MSNESFSTEGGAPASEEGRPALPWYTAKTIGRETIAKTYMQRNGLVCFLPVIHYYYVDTRKNEEKFRERMMFPGYIFFQAFEPRDFGRAKEALGVAYILGDHTENGDIPYKLRPGLIESLIELGAMIEGKRKKFCNGEKVRVILSEISTLLATVESHDPKKRKVKLKGAMFGSTMEFVAPEDKVELVI